jgi:hypothetical protein
MAAGERKTPEYDFEEFRRACEDKNNVFLFPAAEKKADDFFNLRTKTQVLEFIINNGLGNLKFLNKKDWKKNPDPSNPIKIDAYEFRSAFKLGYIAFMHNPKTRKWSIKSFKPSKNANQTMMHALQKAGLLASGER